MIFLFFIMLNLLPLSHYYCLLFVYHIWITKFIYIQNFFGTHGYKAIENEEELVEPELILL
jgi:hypothetical protein